MLKGIVNPSNFPSHVEQAKKSATVALWIAAGVLGLIASGLWKLNSHLEAKTAEENRARMIVEEQEREDRVRLEKEAFLKTPEGQLAARVEADKKAREAAELEEKLETRRAERKLRTYLETVEAVEKQRLQRLRDAEVRRLARELQMGK